MRALGVHRPINERDPTPPRFTVYDNSIREPADTFAEPVDAYLPPAEAIALLVGERLRLEHNDELLERAKKAKGILSA